MENVFACAASHLLETCQPSPCLPVIRCQARNHKDAENTRQHVPAGSHVISSVTLGARIRSSHRHSDGAPQNNKGMPGPRSPASPGAFVVAVQTWAFPQHPRNRMEDGYYDSDENLCSCPPIGCQHSPQKVSAVETRRIAIGPESAPWGACSNSGCCQTAVNIYVMRTAGAQKGIAVT